jgi:hypothetical protein
MATEKTQDQNAPILIERKKSEPKERRTRLNVIQSSEGHIIKGLRRFSQAADKGLATYSEARDESVAKKGDEAFADMLPNMAKGMQVAIETLAPLPTDIVNAFYFAPVCRLVGDGLCALGNLVPNRDEEEDDSISKK